MIVRRERIEALLITTKSDLDSRSDVHLKENIVPVAWGAPSRAGTGRTGGDGAYEPPSIVRRDRVAGLLDIVKSETDIDATPSDAHLKENIEPVVWDARSPAGHADPAVAGAYETPSIARRDRVAGLLDIVKSDGDTDFSDVNLKENFAPVVW